MYKITSRLGLPFKETGVLINALPYDLMSIMNMMKWGAVNK